MYVFFSDANVDIQSPKSDVHLPDLQQIARCVSSGKDILSCDSGPIVDRVQIHPAAKHSIQS